LGGVDDPCARRAPGAPGTPSARPTSPRWPPRNRSRADNDPLSDVCHIFVGGDRAELAWWVLNGDSEDTAENIPAVQSFVGQVAPRPASPTADAVAARSPVGSAPTFPPGFLPPAPCDGR
jgi:hypothetical protein